MRKTLATRFVLSTLLISSLLTIPATPATAANDDIKVAVMGAIGTRTERATMPYDLPDSGALTGKTVTAISIGMYSTCVVASGAPYCWGSSGYVLGNGTSSGAKIPTAVDTSGVLSGKTVTSVAVGSNFACALAAGAVYCWGSNDQGQLGNSTSTTSAVPVAVIMSGVLTGKTITSISAGMYHACVVASGAVYCWGYNNSGQLGNGSTTSAIVPVAVDTSGVLAGKTVSAVSAGAYATCAVASGAAFCWGAGGNGELGNSASLNSSSPVTVTTIGALAGKSVTSIDVGQSHVCAIASGAAFCWGYAGNGRLGNTSVSSYYGSVNAPLAVDVSGVLAGKTVTSISSGEANSCAIASGAAYCWGYGEAGQLGNNLLTTSTLPVAVDTTLLKSGSTYDISSGSYFSCAIASGAAYCWGTNESGRLGNNSTTDSKTPVAVTAVAVLAGKSVTVISAGSNHTCVIASGAAYCWGSGDYGKLGDGSGQTFTTPVAVSTSGVLAGKTITAISAGYNHTCAIASGAAYCWGNNEQGQLGNSSTVSSPTPVAVTATGVLTGKTVTAITTGSNFTCVIAGGAVYCWGSNNSGQLGIDVAKDFFGAYVQTVFTSPVAVDTTGVLKGKSVTSFALQQSSASSTAVIADKKVYSWGNGVRLPAVDAIWATGDLAGKEFIAATGYTGAGCAVTTTPSVICFGSASVSTDGSYRTASIVTSTVIGEKPISAVFSYNGNTCVIAVSSLYCWGYNSNGQLGNHSVTNSSVPVVVDTSDTLKDREIVSVAIGSNVIYVLHRAMSAEAKAAAEKTAAEEVAKAKAAADKALADAAAAAKAKTDAETKAAADAAKAAKAQTDAAARAQAEIDAAIKAKADAEAKAKAAAEAAVKAKSDAAAKAQSDSENALTKALASLNDANSTIANLKQTNTTLNNMILTLTATSMTQQMQIDALNAQIASLLKPKPTIIVCVKGTTVKKVSAINPVCPTGYKKQ